MSLPRQNSQLVDDDGRTTRDWYDFFRRLGDYFEPRGSGSTTTETEYTSLTKETAALGASVALPVSGTWYDGPSVNISAGTWLITATASFNRSTNILTTWEARLYDGANTLASSGVTTPALVNFAANASLSAVISVTASKTIKLQATTNAGAAACLMLSTTAVYGSAKATTISAVRIG